MGGGGVYFLVRSSSICIRDSVCLHLNLTPTIYMGLIRLIEKDKLDFFFARKRKSPLIWTKIVCISL